MTDVDSSILEAFGRGAFKHMAGSLDLCLKGMTERVDVIRRIKHQVSDKSNINMEVLNAVEKVVESTSSVVQCAQEYQVFDGHRYQ